MNFEGAIPTEQVMPSSFSTRARLRLVGVSLENLQEDSPEQLILGAREKGWREAESAIDKAKARFGRGSVRPGRLIKPGDQEEDHAD